jgi:hypothetical protein
MDSLPISEKRMTCHMQMNANGLVSRLLNSGVAEKWTDEIRFTNRFVAHLALYSEYIRSKGATLDLWREVLCIFDSTLRSLDDEEVRTVIVLLEYFLQKIDANQARGQ